MGREVRRVPADWQHPKDENDKYIPTHQVFTYNAEEIEEGLRDGWLENDPPHYGVSVMPDWPAEQRTHYMMYENTTEGTPISPVFATPEELACWLTENSASAFGDMTASYESWLRVANGGYGPSAVITPGRGLQSGVDGLTI